MIDTKRFKQFLIPKQKYEFYELQDYSTSRTNIT